MTKNELNKKKIESLLPHREPMLLIDKLINIVPLKSATAIMYVKKNGFFFILLNSPFSSGESFSKASLSVWCHNFSLKAFFRDFFLPNPVDLLLRICFLPFRVVVFRFSGLFCVWKRFAAPPLRL